MIYGILYNIVGMATIALVAFLFYKIYLASKGDNWGIPRTA